jgi:hypothetical protein
VLTKSLNIRLTRPAAYGAIGRRPARITLATVIVRKKKLTFDSARAEHGRTSQSRVRIVVPEQGIRKNYIGIVSDMTEEERVVLSASRTPSRLMIDLVARLAAALKRRPGDARQRSPAP